MEWYIDEGQINSGFLLEPRDQWGVVGGATNGNLDLPNQVLQRQCVSDYANKMRKRFDRNGDSIYVLNFEAMVSEDAARDEARKRNSESLEEADDAPLALMQSSQRRISLGGFL